MKLTPINASDAPAPEGEYAQALQVVGARELLFISGQIPVANNHVPGDFPAQAALVWRNIDAQLRAAGMSKTDLIKATIFLSNRAYDEANSAARTAYLDGHEIALTVIICGIFDPAWLLEVEAVAAR